jgi:hypothetical protein
MKSISKWFLLSLTGIIFLTGCQKEPLYVNIDENYWLQKEKGYVVYTDFSCDYYIVETQSGYSVIRSFGSPVPFSGDVLYGNFNRWGYIDFYNRSNRQIIRGQVKEYWLSWFAARDMVAYYCGR